MFVLQDNSAINDNINENNHFELEFVEFLKKCEIPSTMTTYYKLFQRKGVSDIRLLDVLNNDQELKDIGIDNRYHRILFRKCISKYISDQQKQNTKVNNINNNNEDDQTIINFDAEGYVTPRI